MSESVQSNANEPACQVSILGTGSYVPEKVMTNADIEKIVDTSDEWIQSRTGIKERRIAADDQATSDLATNAANKALEDAGVAAEDIDLIIVATITPDMFFPATACLVQKNIGAHNAVAFDISAACSGYLYAIQISRHFINTGNRKTVLVIGAEKLSSLINWEDRSTCVLFGDGAGAIVLRRDDEPDSGTRRGSVLSTVMGSDGRHTDILKVPGGGSAFPITPANVDTRPNTIAMEGQEVFKQAVTAMLASSEEAIQRAGLQTEDISLVIAHQANRRIIDAIAKRLKLTEEQTFVNLDKYGNTSAASIAIALDEAAKSGRIKKGDNVLLVAFGAGLTWASTVVRW